MEGKGQGDPSDHDYENSTPLVTLNFNDIQTY